MKPERCQYGHAFDGQCGAEAKHWWGPMWLCWEHYLIKTVGARVNPGSSNISMW